MRTLLLPLIFLAITFAATPAYASRSLAVPSGWILQRRADPDAPISLKFHLVQSNLHNLDAYLLDVSDPQSPRYGHHWTPSSVAGTFRPSQHAVDTVRSWLTDDRGVRSGNIRLSHDGGALVLNVTIAEAESILGTEYNVYQHTEGEGERVGCHQGHSLPEHVAEHVDFVWPTRNFAVPTLGRRGVRPGSMRPGGLETTVVKEAEISTDLEHCDKAVTLDCLRALYNFHYNLVAANKNTVGVVEFGTNIFHPADLDMFFKKFAPDQVGHRPKLLSIAGGHLNASDKDPVDLAEASLDFELVMGLLGHKQEVFLYQTGVVNNDPNAGDELLAAIDGTYCDVEGVVELGLKDCGDQPSSNVISLSYTSLPDIDDPEIQPILRRECAEIGKLRLMGVTTVVASGDVGVAFTDGDKLTEFCLVNNTLAGGNPLGTFVPAFPASCPYVTTVGATSVTPGNTVRDPETATTAFPSGGGFSNTFPIPSYQHAAVTSYLTHFGPSYPADVFNRSGRAFPDVSANGFPTVVVVGGNFTLSGGTSASAPIVASLIVAVNDARLAAGKRPVGFVNPALYSPMFAHAFNDVTNGTNPGCGTPGFPAAPGWDPLTGLGTPNFERLLARFLALP